MLQGSKNKRENFNGLLYLSFFGICTIQRVREYKIDLNFLAMLVLV
jgi:hypothetical protein